MKQIFIFLLLSISLFSSTIENAKKLFDDDKKYKEAIEIFQNYQGDSEVQYYLGKTYLYGMGVDKNIKKAFEYAKKSAKQNYPAGLNLLGVLYQYGHGVKKDELEALINFKQAASLGSIKAMLNIGSFYYKSNVIKVDFKLAKEWFLKAVENGYIDGYLNIGDMYYQNYKDKDALYWYLKFESKVNFHTNKAFKERVASLCRTSNDDKNAIRLYLSLANNGHFEYTFNLLEYIKKYPNYQYKDEMLFFIEKAANKKYNHTKSLALTQNLIYGYYYYDTNQIKKAINFAENLYKKENNIKFGCELAFYYHNNKEYNLDLKKSYDISTKIINENKKSKETLTCYTVLANINRTGNYIVKDTNKSLNIHKELFEIRDKRLAHHDSENIAILYLKLEDYKNARKWYKITYDLTKDKKYLAIVDEYIKNKPIYKIDKKQEQAIYPIIENFTNKDQVATTLETDKYYFIALADKYINMYDKKNLKLLKTFRGWIGTGLNGLTVEMAYDEHKKNLHTTGMNSATDVSQNDIIKVFDIKSGKVVKTIENKNAMQSIYLNISDDGKYLVSINNGALLNIIDTDTNEIQHYNFSNIANFTKVNIIKQDDDYLVNVLSSDNMLYTFSINKKRQIKKEPFNFQTSFKNFNGAHAKNILKDSENNILNINDTDLEKNNLKIKTKQEDKTLSFNFKSLSLNNSDSFSTVNEKIKSNITLKYKNHGATIEVYKNNDYQTSLEFYNVKALSHKVIDDKYILVTTSDMSMMYIFNLEGRAIAKIDGINSVQTNMIYKDGYLISYGKDNIINIFNLEELDKFDKLPQTYDQEILSGFKKTLGGNLLDILNDSDEDIKNVLKLQVKANNMLYTPTPKQFKSYMKMFLLKKQSIKPLSSFYIRNEKDWIMYTPEGLFTYGGDGHKLLKYHQNKGLKKEAKIVENEKLFDKFYRPDLIKKILAGEKVDIPMDVKSVILNILPPELKILFNKMINEKDIELTYEICDAGNGIADPKLIINGQAINPPTSRGFSIEKLKSLEDKCKTYRSTHTLSNGQNSIVLQAYDKDKYILSKTKPLVKTINYKIDEKPNLYFLSIAISDYEDDSYDLKYPVDDVKKVKHIIKQKATTIYNNIYTYTLQDKNVNKNNIDKLFDKISSKIKYNDAFILYIAGHGMTKDGLYQFLGYKKDDKISIHTIKNNLSKIATKKSLILLDTCQSGAIIDGIDVTATTNRLSYDDNRNFIVASSKNQVALEGYKNHGVFTYSVIDAFNSKSKIKVFGLASHISELVPEITSKVWHYEQEPRVRLNKNFLLGKQ